MDIHRQLEGHGNSIKKKHEIKLQQERDLRIALILLDGIQVKLKIFLKFQKKTHLDSILLIMRDGETINIIKKIKK